MRASPRHVLIIDDEPTVSEILFRVVAMHAPSAIITVLLSATLALPMLRAHEVDLLITDNTMPGLSGLELICILRAEGATYPIVLITADTDLPPLQDTGATAIIEKPFRLATVRAELARLLPGSREVGKG